MRSGARVGFGGGSNRCIICIICIIMKDKLVIVRIKKSTREKLKVVAAQEKITLQELLEQILNDRKN